jgi:hypothetical protein
MWLYDGEEFTSEDIGEFKAFVYMITNLENGRRYIGKKRFNKLRTKPPLKGKKRKRKVRSESDWNEYYGSSKLLQEDVVSLGAEKFKREILRLCTTLSEASYYEAKYQFEHDVLLSDLYYNDWIAVKVRKGFLK